GQTFSCKDSVDTTINGVDTMAQSKGRNMKKRSTSVDTSPGQHILRAQSILHPLQKTRVQMGLKGQGQTFSCKNSVDTTINGVDTMAQSKGRNMKKRSTSVDTSPGQVDTRYRSQTNMLTGFYLRSTPNAGRSTLDGSPRRPIFQMVKAGRHEMISGRH
ncbi:hypothetical protein Taro_001091, partial [Colocasia esculenta]|nr:hypothetical protein [Colocasia esculenta]